MINVQKLKGKMAEKGYNGVYMAKVIGRTPKTFYSKMKKGVFDSDEIEKIVDVLDNIDDPSEIFFADKVT